MRRYLMFYICNFECRRFVMLDFIVSLCIYIRCAGSKVVRKRPRIHEWNTMGTWLTTLRMNEKERLFCQSARGSGRSKRTQQRINTAPHEPSEEVRATVDLLTFAHCQRGRWQRFRHESPTHVLYTRFSSPRANEYVCLQSHIVRSPLVSS